jgi:AcrR family transcriptional regulator
MFRSTIVVCMSSTESEPQSRRRRGRPAHNDEAILAAAREVFITDPAAPISQVARHAGVGISALYRRYPSKEELLRTLCADGLATMIVAAQAARAEHTDPWERLAAFIRASVEADTSGLTIRLAGTFTPTPAMFEASVRAGALGAELFNSAQATGAIRPDVEVNDLAMILEQLASITLTGDDRDRALRRRYLELHLDGLRPQHRKTQLPERPPSDEELGARWTPHR